MFKIPSSQQNEEATSTQDYGADDPPRLAIFLLRANRVISQQLPHRSLGAAGHQSPHHFRPLGVLSRSWNASTSFCSWLGIRCSRRRERVTAVELSGLALHGTIPPHVGNLSFLTASISLTTFSPAVSPTTSAGCDA
uniref:Leucine-rich repeat-containing N-terminal plant-type domain-containing protein n=1 Tax=Ananas comosus var. bracteatus TaxID=296719 RepID=A0A6V7Q438_ANACO|nr:unnamed protein product [Ananas comosus var. bracteatus]